MDMSGGIRKSETQFKNNRQNSENYIFAKQNWFSEIYRKLHAKFEGYILIYEAMTAKSEFDRPWTVKRIKMTWFR